MQGRTRTQSTRGTSWTAERGEPQYHKGYFLQAAGTLSSPAAGAPSPLKAHSATPVLVIKATEHNSQHIVKRKHGQLVSSTALKINVLPSPSCTEKHNITSHYGHVHSWQTHIGLDNRPHLLTHLSIEQSIQSAASFRLASPHGSLMIV